MENFKLKTGFRVKDKFIYNYKNINILIIAIWIISSLIVFAFEMFIIKF